MRFLRDNINNPQAWLASHSTPQASDRKHCPKRSLYRKTQGPKALIFLSLGMYLHLALHFALLPSPKRVKTSTSSLPPLPCHQSLQGLGSSPSSPSLPFRSSTTAFEKLMEHFSPLHPTLMHGRARPSASSRGRRDQQNRRHVGETKSRGTLPTTQRFTPTGSASSSLRLGPGPAGSSKCRSHRSVSTLSPAPMPRR